MSNEAIKFSADIHLTSEAGTVDDGCHAARLTVIGLPTYGMADRMAEWIYALVERNLKQAMIDCAPEGSELVEMQKHGDSEGTAH